MNKRKQAFDEISRILAITRLDIEQHQAINDLSLNIHGENYFRDVFNFVYSKNFINANSVHVNEPYIDLVDHTKKEVIQITTTRSKEKILKSFTALNTTYKDYDIKIFYLLKKPKPQQPTIAEIKAKYAIQLEKCLIDATDLITDINNLEESRLIELASRYFSPHAEKYTNNIILNLVIKHLLAEKGMLQTTYDDDFGSVETDEKIKINHINKRISSEINKGLDYFYILEDMPEVTDLRVFIIDDLYHNILIQQLKSKINKSSLSKDTTIELQHKAVNQELDFNKLIDSLQKKISNLSLIDDFNSMAISWIIIAYFFEICDVGVKQ